MSDAVLVACPRCDVSNRLPAARLADGPRCGRCQQPVFEGRPLALTAANFRKHIGGDVPVLVDFWAPWCGPCVSMAPAFEDAAAQLEPELRLAKVDTQDEQALGAEFAIRSIPTLVLFQSGKEIARQSGAMNATQIVRFARSHLAAA